MKLIKELPYVGLFALILIYIVLNIYLFALILF